MQQARYAAIVNAEKFHGYEAFDPGDVVRLVKDYASVDPEAIRVEMGPFGLVGNIANGGGDVPRGCMSAGRLYDKFGDTLFGVVLFVMRQTAIIEIPIDQMRLKMVYGMPEDAEVYLSAILHALTQEEQQT